MPTNGGEKVATSLQNSPEVWNIKSFPNLETPISLDAFSWSDDGLNIHGHELASIVFALQTANGQTTDNESYKKKIIEARNYVKEERTKLLRQQVDAGVNIQNQTKLDELSHFDKVIDMVEQNLNSQSHSTETSFDEQLSANPAVSDYLSELKKIESDLSHSIDPVKMNDQVDAVVNRLENKFLGDVRNNLSVGISSTESPVTLANELAKRRTLIDSILSLSIKTRDKIYTAWVHDFEDLDLRLTSIEAQNLADDSSDQITNVLNEIEQKLIPRLNGAEQYLSKLSAEEVERYKRYLTEARVKTEALREKLLNIWRVWVNSYENVPITISEIKGKVISPQPSKEEVQALQEEIDEIKQKYNKSRYSEAQRNIWLELINPIIVYGQQIVEQQNALTERDRKRRDPNYLDLEYPDYEQARDWLWEQLKTLEKNITLTFEQNTVLFNSIDSSIKQLIRVNEEIGKAIEIEFDSRRKLHGTYSIHAQNDDVVNERIKDPQLSQKEYEYFQQGLNQEIPIAQAQRLWSRALQGRLLTFEGDRVDIEASTFISPQKMDKAEDAMVEILMKGATKKRTIKSRERIGVSEAEARNAIKIAYRLMICAHEHSLQEYKMKLLKVDDFRNYMNFDARQLYYGGKDRTAAPFIDSVLLFADPEITKKLQEVYKWNIPPLVRRKRLVSSVNPIKDPTTGKIIFKVDFDPQHLPDPGYTLIGDFFSTTQTGEIMVDPYESRFRYELLSDIVAGRLRDVEGPRAGQRYVLDKITGQKIYEKPLIKKGKDENGNDYYYVIDKITGTQCRVVLKDTGEIERFDRTGVDPYVCFEDPTYGYRINEGERVPEGIDWGAKGGAGTNIDAYKQWSEQFLNVQKVVEKFLMKGDVSAGELSTVTFYEALATPIQYTMGTTYFIRDADMGIDKIAKFLGIDESKQPVGLKKEPTEDEDLKKRGERVVSLRKLLQDPIVKKSAVEKIKKAEGLDDRQAEAVLNRALDSAGSYTLKGLTQRFQEIGLLALAMHNYVYKPVGVGGRWNETENAQLTEVLNAAVNAGFIRPHEGKDWILSSIPQMRILASEYAFQIGTQIVKFAADVK